MATSDILLSVRAATLPDDSSGSEAAEIVREVTHSAADPQLVQMVARFDDAVNEHLFWQFRLPGHTRGVQQAGCPRLHLQFYLDQDQPDDDRAVAFEAAMLAVTARGMGGVPAGDAGDVGGLSLTGDGGGWVGGTAPIDHADPASRGRLYAIGLDLSSHTDGAVAGDYVVIGLRRRADSPADTALGDVCLVGASLEYTVR